MWGIPVPARVPASGSGWGQVIRYGSGIPADALGNLGDRYYDTAGSRWYVKRWVGNHSGSGDVVSIAKSLSPSGGNFSVSFLLFLKTNANNNVDIFCDGPSGEFNGLRIFVQTGGSVIAVQLRNSGGVQIVLAASQHVSLNSWTKVTVSVASGKLSISYGTINVGSISAAGWSPTPANGSRFFTPNSIDDFEIANAVLDGSGYVASIPFNGGSGTTAIDISGNGNNGTITDAAPTTFWLATWVPLDLL